jgi:hypothetical protein
VLFNLAIETHSFEPISDVITGRNFRAVGIYLYR